MVRNFRGGNKAKKSKNNFNNFNSGPPKYKDESPESDQLYARVLKREGGSPPRVIVYCENGVEKNCTVRGKYKNRVFINPGDTIIITYDKSKSNNQGEVLHKFSQQDVDTLKKEGKINDNTFTKPEDFHYTENVSFEIDKQNENINNLDFSNQSSTNKNSIQNLDNLNYLDESGSDSEIDDIIDNL